LVREFRLINRKTREEELEILKTTSFDCIIIGGGATGSGSAHDAVLRGLKVALLEKNDFASGTSSRSTKLIHGGVRYLSQFHFGLIREALRERKRLLTNAPHLVKPLKFVLPCYKLYERPYYSIGLTLYDFLAGDSGLPGHKSISKSDTIAEFASIRKEKLKGAITYYDSQFNDSRLNVLLARSASNEGAVVLSRMEVISFQKENNKLSTALVKDKLTGKEFTIKAKVFVNATGVHIDEIRKLDDPSCKNVLSPSQGIHLVFPKDKIPCLSAMIIPKTKDGRVVFVIPWEDFIVVGTTDTAITKILDEPLPLGNEIQFLLETVNDYLDIKLTKEDATSVFAGLRPLISPDGNTDTKSISREEVILVSDSGLITMSGGKWSTYRKMAEDLIDRVIVQGNLNPVKKCNTYDYDFPGKKDYTENLYLNLTQTYKVNIEMAKRLRNYYGSEVYDILGANPKELKKDSGYFEEEVVHFIKNEFALSIVDVLARRFRVQFIDLELSKKLIEPIAEVLSRELKWTSANKKSEILEAEKLVSSLEKHIRS
jgi:glycerol-3-phosphate dehydrogenase